MRGSPTPPITYPTAAQGQIPSNISIRRAASRRRAARLGLAGAMITEYPLEHRRYDRPEYEPFWAAAAAGQDPRGRRKDAARREQPRDEGVLSGAVDVRSDLLRRLRASSPPHTGHRRVRAGVGHPTCSARWTTPTANATARRSTGSRPAPASLATLHGERRDAEDRRVSTQHQQIGENSDGPAPEPDLTRDEPVPPCRDGGEWNNGGLPGKWLPGRA